ncbi:class I SAM-dependent methyltransferase [Fictibacillus macauensis]|uniref:class I SAM-dependent methyltransferase n=1 Tax=Fictibacillus macauensis TaxID=245160 RepID=UPI0002F9DCCC|nr:class I SAM-dependent methyltransferase [Fictibacillus macauensis]
MQAIRNVIEHEAIHESAAICEDHSISKSAFFHVARHAKPNATVVELGGGRSTVYWKYLMEKGVFLGNVTTITHDSEWGYALKLKTATVDAIHIVYDSLSTVTEERKEAIFISDDPLTLWKKSVTALPFEQRHHYTVRNAFYTKLPAVLQEQPIDVLLLDGPHGNGRSLAFPLFRHVLQRGTLVLIDDFHHYPFLEDLKKVYTCKELYKETWTTHKWILVELTGTQS